MNPTAFHGLFTSERPRGYVRNAWRMLRYGAWLKEEARRGRFHYLPLPAVVDKLAAGGFAGVEHRLTYVGQAYLFRCLRP